MIKRREFSLSAASAVAATALTLPVAGNALAQARQFKEGKEYRRLDKPTAPDAPAGKIEVIEFFWYSCPHCNVFEPTFDAWVKNAGKDVVVRRVPVAFNASFVPQQKLYYALEGMNKLDELHVRVFRAIHVEKQRLAKDDDIFAWVGKQGVDVNKFKEIYNSFSVSNSLRRATALQDAYNVEGVPSMGVHGKFYTDGTMAGSMSTVLQVVDSLVAAQRKA